MATVREWLSGLRPRTLPASLAPVIIGCGAAAGIGSFSWRRGLLAAAIALALQIGCNLSNDYSDGVRGVDLHRVGPMRLTASGAAPPKQVFAAAMTAFGVAAVLGVILIWRTGLWWLLAVGAACIVAAWYYTGGKRPYGYRGFGELGVFVFFGLVATLGTMITQTGRLTMPSVLGAIGVGFATCALIMVNNLRDIASDAQSGKHTLAVRLGEHRARRWYSAFVWLPIPLGIAAALWAIWSPAVVFLIGPAFMLTMPVLAGASGKALIPILAGTSAYALGYAVILALAFAVAR